MYISNINSSSIKLHAINKEEMTTKQPITIYSEDQVTLLYIIKGGGNYETKLSSGQFKKEDLIILNPGMELTIEPLRKRSEEHTSELQSRFDLVCSLLLEK